MHEEKAAKHLVILTNGLVRPEPSGSGPAVIGEAVAARIGQDEMVEQGDAEQVRALLQPDRELPIFFTGCGIIGRVIVCTNPGGRIHEDQRFEHFARMDNRERE